MLAALVELMIFLPEARLAWTPADVHLAYEDVFLVTEDEVRIHAWWVPAPDEHGVVLLFDGKGGRIRECVWNVEI